MAKLFLYLIGIFWIVIGALSVFATDLARKKFFNKILNISDLKKISPVPIIISVLLLLSASASKYTLFITVLGLLGVIKGILLIVATDKMNKMKDLWLKMNNTAYKIWGVIIIILGSIVLMGIK